jgi:putative SOS response-associated peptidase YedK
MRDEPQRIAANVAKLQIWPRDKMVGTVRNNGPQLILPVLIEEEVPV